MKNFKILSVAVAALLSSTMASAVEVRFLSDDDAAYTVQNSTTRTIDCIAPDTCDVTAGRYRLIGFNDFHSVYVTVNSDGSVQYTYDGGATFPFAEAATTTPPVTPPVTPVTPPVTPTEPTPTFAQYSIESIVVNAGCYISSPGRPSEAGENGCAAMCPDGYTLTGGNCRGTTRGARLYNPEAYDTDIRASIIETPIAGGYQCDYDFDYVYAGSQFDFNNKRGTEIDATAICATIVSQ